MARIKIGNLKPVSLVLLVILFLSFFFRFYHLVDWFSFGMDQEYEAFLVRNIITGKHFPLIGVNAGGTGIYLGPLFIYLAALPYLIFRGNPLGWAFTASFMGVITTWLIYYIVDKLFNQKAALFSSFFYAVSFLASFYDRSFWNPSLVPLLSLLIIYFLYQINLNRQHYLIYLAVIFGLAFHTHLSLLIYTPLIIYVLYRKFKSIKKRILLYSLIIFLILQLPLIIFELRHNFPNSSAVINLVTGRTVFQTDQSKLPERIKVLTNFFGRFIFIPPFPDLFAEKGLCKDLTWVKKNAYPEIVGLSFLGLLYFLISYKSHFRVGRKKFPFLLIISVFLLTIISVLFYPRSFHEYYLLSLFPLLAIILGVSVGIIWQKEHGQLIVSFIISLFFTLNLITLFTAQNSFNYNRKLAVLDFARQYIRGENYNLEALGDCPRFAGWGYLFEYYLGKPLHSYLDSYFGWLNYDQAVSGQPHSIVLLSMIDSRSNSDTIAKWQEDKLRFLMEFRVRAAKLWDNIHVYILSVKK
ncbi:hypothetical protein A2153_05965 [Candidatus Gottesmanbacteria bacterium RBG_16_38_7b]|uniref:Glycosyltransferase RgtA/B/C/D-like domain-containing protein n=1 Tax=Candidatus Gottesmanbacteria bacterium RBG_16_38_7b TaxID=1798372 RepID=A0A1F5YLB1_9BACT|nr:MAG: hypothetical protein A2153_05965 [Candidatus Gottesmanbacteria bacterium RBG_16_38_7b]